MTLREDIRLLLPDIRSCHNVGAMFRTADACGVGPLYLAGYTATPPKPQIDKVSLGAEKTVPWEKIEHAELFVRAQKEAGVYVVVLEKTEGSHDIHTALLKTPLLLIVGNEVDGVGKELLALADQVVHIPMYGLKESLNVSVAAGIAMATLRHRLL
jgi:tRNA G18 (ribose-2'-O)-methylase SpoU